MRLVRPRLTLAAIVVLAALPMAAPVAAKDSAKAEHDRIVAYWTPARMQSAIPRDFVKVGGSFQPKAKPPKPPGGGGGGGAVTGASWTAGGDILARSGKVFFTMSGGRYVCSGSVADDSRDDFSLVLTAAHCAFDEAEEEFATNWMFIPAYDTAPTESCTQAAYGCWTARALVVHDGFASAGGFNHDATVHDFAFAVVEDGQVKSGVDPVLDEAVGSYPLSTSGVNAGNKLYAFGYPAAQKYKGKELTYCAGNVFTDQYNEDDTWGMACGMTGGSSGGPWLSGFEGSNPALSSLNSYGYQGLANMYGPMFNGDTEDVYAAADSATANEIVGG
jgi:Trypsin-like peptidase domain